ncbi:MAG: MFS transporter [Chloroflexi bacterium]|nr:MFS transporter [Chloroflexota bacterium]
MAQKPARIFYGYWILAVSFVSLFVASGLAGYSFSLFVTPLQEEFSWSRAAIMLANAMRMGIQILVAPVIGRVVDRYGPKQVMVAGALIQALALGLLSETGALWFFLACYAIEGIGFTALFTIPTTALVSNWFKKRRGWALGIAAIGVGVGGVVTAPIVGGYLIPDFGWRASYQVLSLATLVLVVPLALLVIKTRPSDLGLHPDRLETSETETVAQAPSSLETVFTLKMAARTSAFWLIIVSYLLFGFVMSGVFQNNVPHLRDIGFSAVVASTAFGIVGAGSAIGKFGFGWLSDLITPKYAYCIGIGFMAAGIFLLKSVSLASPMVVLWLYAGFFGLGIGCFLACISMLVSQNFGLASYGLIYGMITGFHSIGTATGSVMAGYIYDATGNYDLAFSIFLALLLVALVTILPVRRPKSTVISARAISQLKGNDSLAKALLIKRK